MLRLNTEEDCLLKELNLHRYACIIYPYILIYINYSDTFINYPYYYKYYLAQSLLEKLKFQKYPPGQFKYMIYTKVGDGPKYLNNSQDHLLDDQGNPINCS